jgi:hypothetical protein
MRVRSPVWKPGATFIVVAAAIAGCNSSSGTPAAAPSPTAPAQSTAPAPQPSPQPTASAPAASAPPAAIDPCALITKAEADQLASVTLQDASPEGAAGQAPTRCVWPAPLTGSVGQVEIDVGDGAKKALDIDKMLGHEFVPADGVGDEAVVEDFSIFVRTGQTWIELHLVGGDHPDNGRQALQDLAKTMLSRL